MPDAGGRVGTAGGQGRQDTPARSSAPAHVHPVPRSLPLLSFTSVGCGLPVLWGVVYSQLSPPAPSGHPGLSQRRPAHSPGTGSQEYWERWPQWNRRAAWGQLEGGEWVLIVGKGPGQMPPGVPHGQRPRVLRWLIGCWMGLLHWLPRGVWGAGAAALCFLQTACPCTPDLFSLSSRAQPFPGPLQPQTASAGIESLP